MFCSQEILSGWINFFFFFAPLTLHGFGIACDDLPLNFPLIRKLNQKQQVKDQKLLHDESFHSLFNHVEIKCLKFPGNFFRSITQRLATKSSRRQKHKRENHKKFLDTIKSNELKQHALYEWHYVWHNTREHELLIL